KREHFLAMEAVQRVMEQYRWSSDIEALSNSDAIRDSFVKKIRKIVWKELLSAVFPWPTIHFVLGVNLSTLGVGLCKVIYLNLFFSRFIPSSTTPYVSYVHSTVVCKYLIRSFATLTFDYLSQKNSANTIFVIFF
ncbi:unnamed protein product, partial [Albugo candida]